MPSNHLILCHPLLLLPSVFPSIRVFSNESVLCIRWPKYCSLSFSISPSNEYSGLISFRMDWWISLQSKDSQESSPAPQLEASVLCHSAFFMVQPSHPYLTTGKTSVPGRKSGTLGLRKSNRRDGVFSSQVLSNMLDNKSKSCGVVQGNFSVSQRDTRDSCSTKGRGKAAKVSQETGAARVTAERPKATQNCS